MSHLTQIPLKPIQETLSSTLLAGHFGATVKHVNPLTCIVLGLDKPVRVVSQKESIEGEAIVVEPGLLHTVDYQNGRSLALYIERASSCEMTTNATATRSPVRKLGDKLVRAIRDHSSTWSEEIAFEVGNAILGAKQTTDNRVLDVAHRIRSTSMKRLSQTEASILCGLERTTMLRRFRNETGMSFRAYKAWHATKLVIGEVTQGSSIEAAALDNGFYDAPHFSRLFKKTFGLTPTQAQTK